MSREEIVLDAVRAQVLAFHAVTEREAGSRAAVLDGLSRLPRPFDEHADATHVTGSAIVVGRRGTLLHLHKRERRWMQTGGHVDPGEAPWQAAARETLEETGVPCEHPPGGPVLVHLDAHPTVKGHVHLDLRYLLLGSDSDPHPAEGESQQVRWFGWDEAVEVADAALVDGLRRVRDLVAAGTLAAR